LCQAFQECKCLHFFLSAVHQWWGGIPHVTPNNTFPRPLVGYIFYSCNKSSLDTLLEFKVVQVLLSTITKQITSTRQIELSQKNSQNKITNPSWTVQFLLKSLSMMGTPPNTFPRALIGWIFYFGEKNTQLNKSMIETSPFHDFVLDNEKKSGNRYFYLSF
jgi:hypothetical protein